jgi:hypothetical protein
MKKFRSVSKFIETNQFYEEASKIKDIHRISRRTKLSESCNEVLQIIGIKTVEDETRSELEKLQLLDCITILGLEYEDSEKTPFVRLLLKKYKYRIYYENKYFTCVRSDNLEFHYPCLHTRAYQVIQNLLEMEDDIILNFYRTKQENDVI